MLLSDACARIDNARHGGGVFDQRSVLHQAGVHFYACHTWRFARRMTAYATIVANVEYITLPLGCAQVLSIEPVADDVDGPFCIVDAATFNRIRTSSLRDTTGFYATEEWVAGATGLLRRLALHRAPDATVVNGLRLAFAAEWVEPNDAVPGDAVLPVPLFAEPLFGMFLDAFARGLEEDSLDVEVARVQASPLYGAAVEADARALPDGWRQERTWLRTGAYDVDIGTPVINLTPP
jgi:hypothetical protein